jgi:hypothetical protein
MISLKPLFHFKFNFNLFFRNDFYLTIERGNFERGGKAAARNIEVSVMVIDRDGKPIENCIFAAAGIPGRTRLESSVLYHSNSPVWGETFRLEVPIDKFYHSHIRIEYRHCSSNYYVNRKIIIKINSVRETPSNVCTYLINIQTCANDHL